MNRLSLLLLGWLMASPAAGTGEWENPVFDDPEEAVRAALSALAEAGPETHHPRQMFTRFTVSAAERPGDRRFSNVRRRAVDSFLVTYPSFLEDTAARRTLEPFLAEVEDEKRRLGRGLEHFGFQPLPGLTYLKLVENVDQLQEPSGAESSSQINGVTYYCRYVMIPLSYVTARNLKQLQTSALAPGVDAAATLRAWQRDSFRVMISTFRHEMIHVWTNSSLGPPRYRDRDRYPRWFLEGSATFLAADPHEGLSERYQGYQKLFFYLVERHGAATLASFYQRILAGASVRQSLEQTYGIAGRQELRQRQERWHGAKDAVSTVLVLSLLVVVLAAFASRRLPIFGSLQLWLATVLAYSTFSGFCALTQALNGATAVIVQQAALGAGAVYLGARGLRSVRRQVRNTA